MSFLKKLNSKLTLDEARKTLNLKNNELFFYENKLIPINEENIYNLKMIENKNRQIKIFERKNFSINKSDIIRLFSRNLVNPKNNNRYEANNLIKFETFHQNSMNNLFIKTQNKILPKYKLTNTSNLIEGVKFLKKQNSLDIYLYQQDKNFKIQKNYKNIILIGQTGSGKTTLLNSIINYILNIDHSASMRFILFDEKVKDNQAISQTSEVNEYYIKEFGTIPSIRIIDTPGFGNTRGLEYVQKIVLD